MTTGRHLTFKLMENLELVVTDRVSCSNGAIFKKKLSNHLDCGKISFSIKIITNHHRKSDAPSGSHPVLKSIRCFTFRFSLSFSFIFHFSFHSEHSQNTFCMLLNWWKIPMVVIKWEKIDGGHCKLKRGTNI